jgi:flagellar protein FliO/FliZ
MNPAWSSLFWFAVVVAAIPVVLWLFKQSPLGRLHGLKPQAGECPLKPMSTLALSPSQKVVTVEVGQGAHRRWLVLGVTPGSITALHQIDPSVVAPAADPAWQQPHRHTRDPQDGADSMATQPLPLTGADVGASSAQTAAVLPFSQLLARWRSPSADRHHG